ncbi:MAG: sporulation protein YqfD [Oscillospiraceae bacterium]
MRRANLRYILGGYIQAELTGGIPKVFFNYALNSGIDLRNIHYRNSSARFSTTVSGYKQLKQAARLSGSRMRITRKSGLPFILHRMKHAAPLLVGLIILSSLLVVLGSMVFTVEISGNSTIPKPEILKSLNKCGLTVGSFKSGLDTDTIVNKILIEYDSLSWMTINPHYGGVEVQIWEKLDRKEQRTANSGAYICAAEDAQIKSIRVFSGTAAVRAGEVVTKGQKLVIANEFSLDGSWTNTVNADIIAYTEYTASFEQRSTYVLRTRTGKKTAGYGIRFTHKAYYLTEPKCDYRYFDRQDYEKKLRIFDVELPISIAVTEFYEVEQKTLNADAATAKTLLNTKQSEYEKNNFSNGKILNRINNYLEADGKFVLYAEYLCEENIGLCICP